MNMNFKGSFILTEGDIARMKRMFEAGVKKVDLAKIFDVSKTTINYHLYENRKELQKKQYRDYYHKNIEKVHKRGRSWRKKNPEKNMLSVCMSLLRRCFKENLITLNDIKEIRREVRKECQQNASVVQQT